MTQTLTGVLSTTTNFAVAMFGVWIVLYLVVSLYQWLASVCLWRLRRDILAVLLAVATAATIIAQKDRTGGTGTTGVPPVGEQQTGTTGVPPVGDGLTDSLRFAAIDVHADGTATLAVA